MEISELSDIQSESGIVGTLIYHPEYILHTDYLNPSYFYGRENGCIYWAIKELYQQGIDNIDAYNISNMLASHKGVQNTMNKYNMPAVQEFMELYKEVARHTLEEYKVLAQNVVSLAFKRDLIKVLNKVSNICFDKEKKLNDLSTLVYDELNALTEKYITANEVKLFGETTDALWDEICSRRTDDGLYGIPSKYPILSEYFSFEPSELVMIHAGYKQGKSVLLLNETVHKLKNGIPTLYVDTEMSDRLFMERMIAHISGVEVKKIKNGKYSTEEGERIDLARQWIKQQPFVHIYNPNLTDNELYSVCKILKYKLGLQFVVYDYLKGNLISSSDNYNFLGARCDFLKNNIAGDLELAVLSAAQLNREGQIADSVKINRYISTGIKWGFKSREMIANDGVQCGNAYMKIYINRLGSQMPEDDDSMYLDFWFDGDRMLIQEAEQHIRPECPFN